LETFKSVRQHRERDVMNRSAGRTSAGRRERWLGIALAAVLAAVACAAFVGRSSELRARIGPMRSVVRAAGNLQWRAVEGRLAGGFPHLPLRRRVRGVPAGEVPAQIWIAIDTTLQRIGEATAAGRHAAGVGLLVAGRPEKGVESLERSLLQATGAADVTDAFRSSRDPELLSDLSAAYLDRKRPDNAADAFQALEAAERAWRLRQSPEIAWNRALAREALHIRSASLLAWNNYLSLDPDSKWAAEAEEHVRRLRAPSQAQRWKVVQPRIEESGTDYGALVREFPQEIRTYGEGTLLARWAGERLKRDGGPEAKDSRPVDSLPKARAIGAAVSRTSGDQMLADSVAAVDRVADDPPASRRLALAHEQYAKGIALLRSQQSVAAAKELGIAREQLAAAGSPFTLRAALYAASSEYYSGRLDVAEGHLREALTAAGANRERYPTLVGQIGWVQGLIEFSRGHNNEAARAYSEALEAFVRAGEPENRAGVETVLAELHQFIGDDTAACVDQQRALESLEILGTTGRSFAILTAAADAAQKLELPRAALVLQDDLLTITRAAEDPVSLCVALVTRSSYAASISASSSRRAIRLDTPVVPSRLMAQTITASGRTEYSTTVTSAGRTVDEPPAGGGSDSRSPRARPCSARSSASPYRPPRASRPIDSSKSDRHCSKYRRRSSGVSRFARCCSHSAIPSRQLLSASAASAGERARAETDLLEARRLLKSIDDSGMLARARSYLLATEAVVWRTFDPRRAAEASRDALAEMGRLGNHGFAVALHLERGRALSTLGPHEKSASPSTVDARPPCTTC
jgi:hypothetical protein